MSSHFPEIARKDQKDLRFLQLTYHLYYLKLKTYNYLFWYVFIFLCVNLRIFQCADLPEICRWDGQEMGLTADSMDDFLDQGAAETQDSETLPQRPESKFDYF